MAIYYLIEILDGIITKRLRVRNLSRKGTWVCTTTINGRYINFVNFDILKSNTTDLFPFFKDPPAMQPQNQGV